MTRGELAAVAFLSSMLLVVVSIVGLVEWSASKAALPQSPYVSEAVPPGALSAPPPRTCSASDMVSEAGCLNRCLAGEIDFVFYHSSDGVLCMVPCALAVGGVELKGY